MARRSRAIAWATSDQGPMAERMASTTLLRMARTQTAEPVIFRGGVIALVMVAQVTLSALAFSSLVDPSWIAGIYDDADYDDVVALATAGTGNVAPVILAVSRPSLLPLGRLLDCGDAAAPVRSASALHPRAPPTV